MYFTRIVYNTRILKYKGGLRVYHESMVRMLLTALPPNRGSAAQSDLLGGSVRRPTHQRRQSAEVNNISLGSTPRSVRQNVLADREAL